MLKHNSIDKKADSSILQLPSEVFGLARFRLSNLSSRFRSPSDNSAKVNQEKHKTKNKQEKTFKDKSKYNKQLSIDTRTASKPIQRQASLNGESCSKSFPETSCYHIDEQQSRRADSEERRKPTIESICLFPKLVLPINKAGDAPPKSPDLSEKPRKKLSFREPEIVTKESNIQKHDTLLENGKCDIDEMELESQALRIVRSVGQAFDNCKDFSMECDSLVLNQSDAERENNTEEVAPRGNSNVGAFEKSPRSNHRFSSKTDPLKGQLYEVQQMLLREQDLDLEDLDYDTFQLETNNHKDLTSKHDSATEAPAKETDTLETNSHDSNESNLSESVAEKVSKFTYSTDTFKKNNAKLDTSVEETIQFLSDGKGCEKTQGSTEGHCSFSETPEGFINHNRIRTPEIINDLKSYWQKGEVSSIHTSKSELPSPVFVTKTQDFDSRTASNVSVCNVLNELRNVEREHNAQSLEATARDFAEWIKLNSAKLEVSDDVPKNDNAFLLKLFAVILDYQDELGKLTEKLQTYENLLRNVYYQLIKFLGVNTCVSAKMKTLSGEDKHNVHLLTLILLLKELENDMESIKDTVYTQLLDKCSEDQHQEQIAVVQKDIKSSTSDIDADISNEEEGVIKMQNHYQPITFHYHPHLGGYIAYPQAQSHEIQGYACSSEYYHPTNQEGQKSPLSLDPRAFLSLPQTPTSPKFEEMSPAEDLRQNNNRLPIFLPQMFGTQMPYNHNPRADFSSPAAFQTETSQPFNQPVLFLPRIPMSQNRPLNQRASIPRPNNFQTSIPRPVNPTVIFNNNNNKNTSESDSKNSKN